MAREQALNPAQREVLEVLGAPPGARPEFDARLRDDLRAALEEDLAPLVGHLPDGEDLFLTKHRLGAVHGCEASYLAEEEAEFAWNVPLARGTVAHKAIELSVHWRGEITPLELVDEAIARLTEDDRPLSDWLQSATDADHAELRASANDRVAKFLECFPRLDPRWRPVTESRSRVELFGERVVLIGRVDLTLGAPEGPRAGKVIVDLKTGGFWPGHVDDLRFYALVETLRVGTPPRTIASYYLDSATVRQEQVSEGVLEAALARTVAGAERLVALHHGGETPVKRPGARCRWCPMLDDCEEGRRHLAEGSGLDLDDPEDLGHVR